MDAYAPLLIEKGLKVMIGKGMRAQTVKDAMTKHKAA
jgi:fumarate hydratase subunit beta